MEPLKPITFIMSNNPFDMAIELCKKSSYKVRMGAVVVHKGKIVGAGCNRAHSTGTPLDGDHAEKVALYNTTARYRNGSTVYVGRLTRNNEIALAKPCGMCQTVMRKMGVKYVWYSSHTGWTRMVL